MPTLIGLVALAAAGGLLYSAHRAAGHSDYRRMFGGYLGFIGAFLMIAGVNGYTLSHNYLFEIIFGLTTFVFAFLILYHVKYNRAEAAKKEVRPVNDDRSSGNHHANAA